MENSLSRCDWGSADPVLIHYHDTEWGDPVHNDNLLFEFLSLDCFQAGLSWLTILKKREGFRKAFDGFSIDKVAQYDNSRIAKLLTNPEIIRNKQKINAVINNACHIQKIREEYGSFDHYIWQFTNYKTIINTWDTIKQVPATSSVSDKMSLDLKKRNLKFVGSTICYAFMQSIGMVNDHTRDCFRYTMINEIIKKNES